MNVSKAARCAGSSESCAPIRSKRRSGPRAAGSSTRLHTPPATNSRLRTSDTARTADRRRKRGQLRCLGAAPAMLMSGAPGQVAEKGGRGAEQLLRDAVTERGAAQPPAARQHAGRVHAEREAEPSRHDQRGGETAPLCDRAEDGPPADSRRERDDRILPVWRSADQRAGALHDRFRQDFLPGGACERPRRGDVAGGIRAAPEPFGDALPLVRIEPPLGKRRQIEKEGALVLDRLDHATALPKK